MNRKGMHIQVLLCLGEIDPHLQVVPRPEAEWLWSSSCLVQQIPQSSYSEPWGHAFLPMCSTCLFTVSLLCLGLFQLLPLPLWLAFLPASFLCVCVCVGGVSSTRRELDCFKGKRNLSCLSGQRQLSSSLPINSILGEWVQSRCCPKLSWVLRT